MQGFGEPSRFRYPTLTLNPDLLPELAQNMQTDHAIPACVAMRTYSYDFDGQTITNVLKLKYSASCKHAGLQGEFFGLSGSSLGLYGFGSMDLRFRKFRIWSLK